MEQNKANKNDFKIRPMNKEDIPEAMEIFKQCGWFIGKYHLYTLLEVDPNAWKVAVSNAGKLLGLGGLVQISEDFLYAGYWAVRKECRKMGIGEKITDILMEQSGSKNICLNAFPDMFPKYKERGVITNVDTDPIFTYKTDKKILVENLSSMIPEGVTLVQYEDSHLTAMLAYDDSLGEKSPVRHRYLELNSKEKGSKTFVAFKKGVCVGFGTMAITLFDIPRLAPLYADDVEIAEAIMKKLLQSFPDHQGLFMSTFAGNKAANDLMDKIKCPKSSESYHMYRKEGRVLHFKSSMHRLFAQLDLGFMEY